MLPTADSRNPNTGDYSFTLPSRPWVIIEPNKSLVSLNLKELWNYRELLYFLIWRDVKVRYKQTTLGIAWVILQPALMTVIFTIFLGRLVRIPTGNTPYALVVYIGLLPWTFFSSAVLSSGTSIVANAQLITKIYFPRVIAPAAAVGARLVDFAISFVILIGLMSYFHVGLTLRVLMLPVLLLLVTLLALGVGTIAAALNVRYRDVSVILPVLIQLGMFISPVLYPQGLVPERWHSLYMLNPMVGIISAFRAALIGDSFQWTSLGVSALESGLLVIISVGLFRRVEKEFADIV
jgi:lipopolysaccharide transport system permease protein